MKKYRNTKQALKQNQKILLGVLAITGLLLGFMYLVATPGIDTGNTWFPLDNYNLLPAMVSGGITISFHGFPFSFLADGVYASTGGLLA